MIEKAIKDSFALAKRKNWSKVYWAIDIHGTIIRPTYSSTEPDTFYDNAIMTLNTMSLREDICIILYTCSYPEKIQEYIEKFAALGIRVDYINENPEITDNHYSSYLQKFYFNVLLDDKAGFDPEYDWDLIDYYLEEIPLLKQIEGQPVI